VDDAAIHEELRRRHGWHSPRRRGAGRDVTSAPGTRTIVAQPRQARQANPHICGATAGRERTGSRAIIEPCSWQSTSATPTSHWASFRARRSSRAGGRPRDRPRPRTSSRHRSTACSGWTGATIADVGGMSLASVVPALTAVVSQVAERRGLPLLVAGAANMPMPVRGPEGPVRVGPDRLVQQPGGRSPLRHTRHRRRLRHGHYIRLRRPRRRLRRRCHRPRS